MVGLTTDRTGFCCRNGARAAFGQSALVSNLAPSRTSGLSKLPRTDQLISERTDEAGPGKTSRIT